ncbi:MAG: VIT1/CCC1 transporter family protein [Pseudomonadota bacterium]
MTLEHGHSAEEIRARLAEDRKPNYVRDWVYGGIDGAITTFAIVAGVVGAALSSKVIVILGLANLLADGFSMAASNYSGTKAEVDDHARLWAVERKHIAKAPEGEREEVRQILLAKGLSGDALEEAVAAITSSEETWVETMLTEEYGLSQVQRVPLLSGASTFAAFLLCGAVPLLPYLLSVENAFFFAVGMTAVVFFVIGALKARWSLASWWASGMETLSVGLLAASAAFAVGYLLRDLV